MHRKVEHTFPEVAEDRGPAAVVAAEAGVGHRHRKASPRAHQGVLGFAYSSSEGRQRVPGQRLALGMRRV